MQKVEHQERKNDPITKRITKNIVFSFYCYFSQNQINYIISTATCFLSDNIYDYTNVSQGKITIPNIDDGEEFVLTDVSLKQLQPG